MHRSLVKGVKLKINRISNPRRLEYSYSFWRPNRFPLNNFKHYLTLFSKFFSSFPHGTCSLSVFRLIFSLGWSSPPRRWSPVNRATHHISFGLHSQTTRLVERQRRGSFKSQRPLVGTCRLLWPRPKKTDFALAYKTCLILRDYHPRWSPLPGELGLAAGAWSAADVASKGYNLHSSLKSGKARNFKRGLFPFRSPLLGESSLVSFPPLIEMLQFGG